MYGLLDIVRLCRFLRDFETLVYHSGNCVHYHYHNDMVRELKAEVERYCIVAILLGSIAYCPLIAGPLLEDRHYRSA